MSMFRNVTRWVFLAGILGTALGCASPLGMREYLSVEKNGLWVDTQPGVPIVIATSGLDAPTRLALHPTTGAIYVTDVGDGNPVSGRILAFTYEGTPDGVLASGLNNPRGIAVSTNGTIYYSLAAFNAMTYQISGGVNSLFSSAQLGSPQGIAWSNGTLYITIPGNAVVGALDASGNPIVSIGWGNGSGGFMDSANGSPQLGNPVDVAFNPTSPGLLYIVDQANHAIRVGKAPDILTTLAGGGPSAGTGAAPALGGPANAFGTSALFNQPSGIALNPSRTALYVADTGNNAIRKINLATTEVTVEAAGGLINAPTGIAFGPDGNLYFANTGASNILKLTPQ